MGDYKIMKNENPGLKNLLITSISPRGVEMVFGLSEGKNVVNCEIRWVFRRSTRRSHGRRPAAASTVNKTRRRLPQVKVLACSLPSLWSRNLPPPSPTAAEGRTWPRWRWCGSNWRSASRLAALPRRISSPLSSRSSPTSSPPSTSSSASSLL